MRKTYVIYHANCLDGMTSAAIAYQYFGDQATYLPGVYDKLPFDELVDADVFMLDFSLKEAPLRELIEKGNKVTIIDHHEDAIEAIRHVPIHELIYDINESGASLTWGYFFQGLELPRMVSHARDYDLWRFQVPNTHGFIAYIEQFPLDIKQFNQLLNMSEDDYEKAIMIGTPLYQYKMNLVETILKGARPCLIKGRQGWMINGPYPLASVIGEALGRKTGTYAMIWSERADRMVQISFRATGGTIAKELAIELGGNGHKTSGGCAISIEAFQKLIRISDRALDDLQP